MFNFRRHKTYQPPNKRITDKDEIVRYAKTYFYNNSIIDLYWFIHNDMQYPDLPDSFARDVAHKMVGTGQFKFAYTDHQQYFLIIKSSWTEAHPIKFAIAVAAISAILSVISSRLTDQDKSQLQFLKDTQQDSIIHSLQSKISILQIDTAKNQNNRIRVSSYNESSKQNDTTHR